MADITLIRSNLDNQGFHSGIVNEFIKDMDLFYRMAAMSSKSAYQESVKTNGVIYTQCIHGKEGRKYPNTIKLNELPERLKMIKENGYTVDQQWAWYGSGHYHGYWNKIIEPLLFDLYKDLSPKNIHHEAKFTLYQDGDFTDVHKDSEAPGRKCAFLIYFSKPEDYNDGGGKLILGANKDKNYVKDVLPITPNYVIIDIEKHSLYHAVEPVKNGFMRYAFLDFVWNYDQIPKERRPQRT